MSKSDNHDEPDATLPIVVTTRPGSGRRGHGQLLDAHAAMPGAIKHVGGDSPSREEVGAHTDKAELRRKYFEYVQRLAHPPEGTEPTVANALAATFGIPVQEAEQRQIELHDLLQSAVRSMSFGEALRKKDVAVEARVSMLARWAYSADPRISLTALKVLNDMDEGATSSSEETIEDHIAALLEG